MTDDVMTVAGALEVLRDHASETDRYLPTDRELDLAEAIRVVDAAGLLGDGGK